MGYKRCVEDATTENGTLIDHVYLRGLESVKTEVIPRYYSYHETVKTKFWNNKENKTSETWVNITLQEKSKVQLLF